jgi:hypothetical protein
VLLEARDGGRARVTIEARDLGFITAAVSFDAYVPEPCPRPQEPGLVDYFDLSPNDTMSFHFRGGWSSSVTNSYTSIRGVTFWVVVHAQCDSWTREFRISSGTTGTATHVYGSGTPSPDTVVAPYSASELITIVERRDHTLSGYVLAPPPLDQLVRCAPFADSMVVQTRCNGFGGGVGRAVLAPVIGPLFFSHGCVSSSGGSGFAIRRRGLP